MKMDDIHMQGKCPICNKRDYDKNMPRYLYKTEFDEYWTDRCHPWCISDYIEFETYQSMSEFIVHPDDEEREAELWQETKGVSPNTGHMWLTQSASTIAKFMEADWKN